MNRVTYPSQSIIQISFLSKHVDLNKSKQTNKQKKKQRPIIKKKKKKKKKEREERLDTIFFRNVQVLLTLSN